MMSVVRMLRRKANSTTTTSTAPHSTTFRTALIDRSTKIAESIRVLSLTAGISVLIRSISARTPRATDTVIDRSTKIAESIRVLSLTAGISVLIRSISARTPRATDTVLRPDCLLTAIWTAVRPLMRTRSSWSSVPSVTSARSRR